MVNCINFKSFSKGVTIGFCDFYIEKWGVNVYGCSLCMKNGHRWINFPSRSYTNSEGETKYMPYIRFEEKEHKDKFDLVAIEAIDKYCKENNIDNNEHNRVIQERNYTEGDGSPF